VGERALALLSRPRAECSVILVDDDAIAALNRTYRGVRDPTDVLAFAMTEGPFGASWPDLLGDVVISVETARRQARERGGSLRSELALLLVHGILHLLGYDHDSARRRRAMWPQQRAILETCGITPAPMGPSGPVRRLHPPSPTCGRKALR